MNSKNVIKQIQILHRHLTIQPSKNLYNSCTFADVNAPLPCASLTHIKCLVVYSVR